jgi:hypothetical protein
MTNKNFFPVGSSSTAANAAATTVSPPRATRRSSPPLSSATLTVPLPRFYPTSGFLSSSAFNNWNSNEGRNISTGRDGSNTNNSVLSIVQQALDIVNQYDEDQNAVTDAAAASAVPSDEDEGDDSMSTSHRRRPRHRHPRGRRGCTTTATNKPDDDDEIDTGTSSFDSFSTDRPTN